MGVLALLCAGVIGGDAAWGVTSTWQPFGAGTTNWFTTTKWNNGVPNAPGDVAILPGNIPALSVSAPVTLGGMEFVAPGTQAISGVGPITFDNPGEAAAQMRAYAPRNGAVTVTLGVPVGIAEGESLKIDVGPGSQLTLGGGIASAGGDVEKIGSGVLIIGGASANWSGHVTVQQGALHVNSATTLGNSAGGISLRPGASLIVSANIADHLDVDDATLVLRNSQRVLTGAIDVKSKATFTMRDGYNSFHHLEGDISGDGELHFVPDVGETSLDGRIFVRGDNSYKGKTYFTTRETLSGDGDWIMIESATGLGSAEQGTIVDGGNLGFFVSSAEPLELIKGRIDFVEDAIASGHILLRGGVLRLGNVPHVSPIEIANEGGNPAILSGTIEGGTEGFGDLEIGGVYRSVHVQSKPLAHDGGVRITGYAAFHGENTYTGKTVVEKWLEVNHAAALGASTSPVEILKDARIVLDAASSRDFQVTGILDVVEGNHTLSGNITLGGGAGISDDTAIDGHGNFTGEIKLLNSGRHSISGNAIDAPIVGRAHSLRFGDVQLNVDNSYESITTVSGHVVANSPYAFGSTRYGTIVDTGVVELNVESPETFVVSERGGVNVKVQQSRLPRMVKSSRYVQSPYPAISLQHDGAYAEQLEVVEGAVEIANTMELAGVTIRDAGKLSVAPGATLSVAEGPIVILNGSLEGAGLEVNRIDKRGGGGARLGSLGDFAGAIHLSAGNVEAVSSYSLGHSAGSTTIGATAHLVGLGVLSIDDDLHLSQTDTAAVSASLSAADVGSSAGSNFVVKGDLYVAQNGSVIGGGRRDGKIHLDGLLHGGTIILNGENHYVTLSSSGHTLDGSVDVRKGNLILTGDGAIETADVIRLYEEPGNQHGRLVLENRNGTRANRIGHGVAVAFHGGSLEYSPGTDEVIGSFKFVEGNSDIERDTTSGPARSVEIESIQRTRGAVTRVYVSADAVVRTSDSELSQKEILPWMLVYYRHDSSSVTHGFGRVVGGNFFPITDVVAIGQATANDDAIVDSALALNSSKTVRSLNFVGDHDLDLGGNLLKIDSGGALVENSIVNGTLTAGALGGHELILYGGRIRASIVDDGSQPVSVVLNEGVDLYEANSYSGATYVTDGAVAVYKEGAIPDGTDLTIVGGEVSLEYVATRSTDLKHIRIAGGGILEGNGQFGFERMTLEEGGYSVRGISGQGVIVKQTMGDAWLSVNRNNSTFAGEILVEEGHLRIDGIVGNRIQVKGGSVSAVGHEGTIELAGGSLRLDDAWPADYEVLSDIYVSADSRIIASRNFPISGSLMGELFGDGRLTFASFHSVAGDLSSVFVGGANAEFFGDVEIDAVNVGVGVNSSLGTGEIVVRNGGALRFGNRTSPPRTDSIKNDIWLENGGLDGTLVDTVFEGTLTVTGASYAGNLTSTGSVKMQNGSRLSLLGAYVARFEGPLLVSGSAEVHYGISEGNSLFTSDVPLAEFVGTIYTDSPQSVLDFVSFHIRPALFDLSLHASAGQTLTLLHNGLPFDQTISGVDDSVSGNGTIANNITLTDGATVSPGNSPGLLTIDGDLTMTGGSRLAIEIGGTTRGVDYDTLVVTGALNLENALLDVSFINGFTPMLGDTFSIVEAGSLSGRFANLPDSILVGNYALELNYGPNGLGFTTVRVPEPATAAVVGLLVLGLMTRRLRGRG